MQPMRECVALAIWMSDVNKSVGLTVGNIMVLSAMGVAVIAITICWYLTVRDSLIIERRRQRNDC